MATSGDIKSVRFRAIGTYPGEDFRLGLFVHSLSLARGSEAKDEVEFGLDMPRHARTASSDDVFVSGHPAEVAASKHIDSRVVSRSHARLFWSKLYHTRRLALKIVDLKSTHGTILRSRSGEKNIQLVPFLEHELEHGDILILGRRVEKGSETYEPPAFEIVFEYGDVMEVLPTSLVVPQPALNASLPGRMSSQANVVDLLEEDEVKGKQDQNEHDLNDDNDDGSEHADSLIMGIEKETHYDDSDELGNSSETSSGTHEQICQPAGMHPIVNAGFVASEEYGAQRMVRDPEGEGPVDAEHSELDVERRSEEIKEDVEYSTVLSDINEQAEVIATDKTRIDQSSDKALENPQMEEDDTQGNTLPLGTTPAGHAADRGEQEGTEKQDFSDQLHTSLGAGNRDGEHGEQLRSRRKRTAEEAELDRNEKYESAEGEGDSLTVSATVAGSIVEPKPVRNTKRLRTVAFGAGMATGILAGIVGTVIGLSSFALNDGMPA